MVPVLRPVTDCRPFERLGLDQTGILGGVGKRPGFHGPRAKKGSDPRGGVPPESVTAHHRLPGAVPGFLDFVYPPSSGSASHPPPLRSSSSGHPHRRLGPTAPLLRLRFSVAPATPSATPDNSAVEMRAQLVVAGRRHARRLWSLSAYRSEKRLSLRPFPPTSPTLSLSRFPFRRFT